MTGNAFLNPAFVSWMLEHVKRGTVQSLEIRHTEGCPALKGGGLYACTCDETEWRMVPEERR